MKSLHSMCAFVCLLASLGGSLAGAARAGTPPELILSDGAGNSVTIDSTGSLTCSGTCTTNLGPSVSSGSIVWAGTFGPFTANIAAGLTKPALTSPQIQIGFLVTTKGAGGSLTAQWTDTGFYGVGSATMTASDTLAGSVNASYTSYIDNTNQAFGMGTTVGTISNHVPPGSSTTVTGSGPVAEPFSMTNVVTATMGPQSSFSLAGFLLMASPPPPLTLACATGSGEVGMPFNASLMASGGVPPYTYSIASGSLPSGLGLNPTSGEIAGTANAIGTFAFTAQVVDSSGNAAQNTVQSNCGVTITPPPTPLALSCAAPTAEVGVPYSSSLVATGGISPYVFSISNGSLPPGLTLNPTTGAITGTPTTSGPFSFTAQVVDSSGDSDINTVTVTCGITVTPALALSCAAGSGEVGVAYSSALQATGGVGPYTYSIVSGSLPAGLTLNSVTGAITGIPNSPGAFSFTARVVDSSGNAGTNTVTSNCGITILPALSLMCAASGGQVGTLYSSNMVASGGVGPYTYSLSSGSLPPGLTLNPATGAITGTPTTSGTFSFTAKVVDSSGNAASNTSTSNCSIVIAPPPLTLACASGSGQVGVPYNSSLVAGGGVPPYGYSISSGALPAGLMLNAATGTISGTPTTSGTFNFTAKAVDSSGNAASNSITSGCGITIIPPAIAPLIVSCAASTGQVGLAYSSAIGVTGGVALYTFAISSGSLPPGLTLNPSSGAITGTPSSEGSFSFTVTVTDSAGNSGTTVTSNCNIVISTCGTSLARLSNGVSESCTQNQVLWFNSHLDKLGGTIPNSNFQIFVTGGKIGLGPATLSVPDAVITFSSAANCAQTSFNAALNRWETTVPLSAASRANQIFAAGLAYLPSGFSQNVNSATWSADVTSTAPGVQVTWQFGVSNWLVSTRGAAFPSLNSSPFVPDYNGMQVNAANGAALCSGNSSDQAGAPEFASRQSLFASNGGEYGGYGGVGGGMCGGANWTGSFSPASPPVTACSSSTPGHGSPVISCPASSGQQGSSYNSSFTASGGSAPYTFSITRGWLPQGLSLNATTGAITGKASGMGQYTFTGQVTDASGNSGTVSCTINLACGGWR